MSVVDSVVSVERWLQGRSVFITGATGFIGKVLVEKLLRSCPDLGSMYLLLRPKRGKSGEERIQDMTSSPCFDNLKAQKPECLKKIISIAGDVSEIGLGISDADRQTIIDNVSVIFHVAASVRFDDSLQSAIMMNTRGTREIVTLAQQLKDCQVLVHVSTLFTNCEGSHIEENMYPRKADWRKMIDLAETRTQHQLDVFTEKALGFTPNTYIFTKSLAEDLVYEVKDTLPIAIVRPSLVVASINEPVPGWVDNVNHALGLGIAGSKGLLRVYPVSPTRDGPTVCVDVVSSIIIAAGWRRAVLESDRPTSNPIVNCATDEFPIMNMVNFGISIRFKEPLKDVLWDPFFLFVLNPVWFWFLYIVLQMIPAFLADRMLIALGKQPRLSKITRLIFVTFQKYAKFLNKEVTIETKEMWNLRSSMLKEDQEVFRIEKIRNMSKYMKDSYTAMRVYVMKDPREISKETFRHSIRMYWIDCFTRVVLLGLLLWMLPLTWMYQTVATYFTSSYSSLFVLQDV